MPAPEKEPCTLGGAGVSPYCTVALPSWKPSTSPNGQVLRRWRAGVQGAAGWLPRGPAAGLRPPAHSRLRRVPPIQAWMMHAWCHAWLDPAPSGGRAHQVVRKSHAYRLPWRSSFPQSGSCCVSNNPRGFLYLSADSAAIGKIGRHVRLLLLPKREKEARLLCALIQGYGLQVG